MVRQWWQHDCCSSRDSIEDDKMAEAVVVALQCSGRQGLQGTGVLDNGGGRWGRRQ